MADVFVSYARSDLEQVRRIVTMLEEQGWSVWWDTRIVGGDRWDATIEREIALARCVVVVWTPQSINREWVHVEAHHGRNRGILVPIMINCNKLPFAFSLIQTRNLSDWDGTSISPLAAQFLADVRQKLEAPLSASHPQPTPAGDAAICNNEAERAWRVHNLDTSDDIGLLKAYVAKWDTVDKLWSYKAAQTYLCP